MDIPIFEKGNSISAKAFRDGYELGKSNVKSSLKRDIEKMIKESEITIDPMLRVLYITALKEVIELIETVEP
jgi:hypothetical protein